jgi:hypothetical protein
VSIATAGIIISMSTAGSSIFSNSRCNNIHHGAVSLEKSVSTVRTVYLLQQHIAIPVAKPVAQSISIAYIKNLIFSNSGKPYSFQQHGTIFSKADIHVLF